jgi:hypothetical protein
MLFSIRPGQLRQLEKDGFPIYQQLLKISWLEDTN